MHKKNILNGAIASCLMLLAGCSSEPLSQGRSFDVEKTACSYLPGWNQDNFEESLPALLRSCQRPNKDWSSFCRGLQSYQNASSDEIKSYLEENLVPYTVSSYGSETGIITGYYEAELTGTRTRVSSRQVPVFGVPYGYKNGKTYPEREDIDEDFEAPIIAWADDPVELFILQIQGSGRMITPDGEIKLGYGGNNNRPFKGMGEIMRDAGIENMYSMPQMKKWLQSHPEEAIDLMNENPRYIFFKEIVGESPYGAAGVVLTPERSVAVDRAYIPMHTLMWLDTRDPDGLPIQKLVVAQDVGSAIQGGIRADYFWGHGEAAFNKAGRMKSKGRYFLLLPKTMK